MNRALLALALVVAEIGVAVAISVLAYRAGLRVGLCLEACAVGSDADDGPAEVLPNGSCWCVDPEFKKHLTPSYLKRQP